jgi:hypothetical protein
LPSIKRSAIANRRPEVRDSRIGLTIDDQARRPEIDPEKPAFDPTVYLPRASETGDPGLIHGDHRAQLCSIFVLGVPLIVNSANGFPPRFPDRPTFPPQK